jgi:flagellar basal-body rod protein FlgG
MDYGSYLSAAGVLTNMHRTDVFANNLANVNTAAFKPDFAIVRQRLPERLEDNIADVPPQELLERLGGGVLMDPTRVNLAQGSLELTENPLDIALQGDGFFVVDSGKGSGDERLRLSRDGRLSVDARGTLVRVTDGLPVLDRNNRAIRLRRNAPVDIDDAGTIRQDGRAVARLRVVNAADDRLLAKDGANLLSIRGGTRGLRKSDATVRQGMVEASGVDPIKAMLAINRSTGAMNRNTKMIEVQDQTIRGAINNLGRIA